MREGWRKFLRWLREVDLIIRICRYVAAVVVTVVAVVFGLLKDQEPWAITVYPVILAIATVVLVDIVCWLWRKAKRRKKPIGDGKSDAPTSIGADCVVEGHDVFLVITNRSRDDLFKAKMLIVDGARVGPELPHMCKWENWSEEERPIERGRSARIHFGIGYPQGARIAQSRYTDIEPGQLGIQTQDGEFVIETPTSEGPEWYEDLLENEFEIHVRVQSRNTNDHDLIFRIGWEKSQVGNQWMVPRFRTIRGFTNP